MADFYLASHSARRRELLRQIGARFETLLLRIAAPRGPDVGEEMHAGELPADYARRIAQEKAEHGAGTVIARSMLVRPVLAADTVVSIDGQVLGKPRDAAEAAQFLRQLSGRTHEVRTAISLALPGGGKHAVWSAESVTLVSMRSISEEEIARYCASGEPFDKAGGYAIQGRAAIFIGRIEGSYSGVVGLPLAETADILARAGVRLL